MMAFDAPKREHQRYSYEKRYKFLIKNVPISHPFTVILNLFIKRKKKLTKMESERNLRGLNFLF